MYIYIHTLVYIHMYTDIHIHAHNVWYIPLSACPQDTRRLHPYTHTHTPHTHMYTYTCIYIYIYIYIYMHRICGIYLFRHVHKITEGSIHIIPALFQCDRNLYLCAYVCVYVQYNVHTQYTSTHTCYLFNVTVRNVLVHVCI